jgi:hypothetical protein
MWCLSRSPSTCDLKDGLFKRSMVSLAVWLR